MKTASIAIGARIGHAPDPAFFCSWTGLLRKGLEPADKVLMPAVGLPHSCAANVLADQFLGETECDALLMLDDDVVFDADALARLRVSAADYDILSALYVSRRGDPRPVALRYDGNRYVPMATDKLTGAVDCDVVGLGFCLIGREVMEAVAKQRAATGIFAWSNQLGEDGEFCVCAKGQGFRVGVDSTVIIGHRITFTARWAPASGTITMDLEHFGLEQRKDG